MKKFLALVMAMMMVLAMGTAFAEGNTDTSTVTFTKIYSELGVKPEAPTETFEIENVAFVGATNTGVGYTEEWAKANLPVFDTVTFERTEVGVTEKQFTVTLPENYPSVGVYTYSFNEKDNNTEGVTYYSTQMKLVVTVIQDTDAKLRVAAVHCEGGTGNTTTKTDEFKNTYTAGALEIKKTVSGNLADQNKEFEVTVTLKAGGNDVVKSNISVNSSDDADDHQYIEADGTNGWTEKVITLKLNHNETVLISNIPAGVTYTVEETDAAVTSTEYKATYTGETTGEIKDATVSVAIENNKDATIDTGILLDNAPYMMIMAMVVLAGVAMMMKRRAY